MVRRILAFFTNDRGQDIAEYCLMTALVALVALGIFVHLSGGVQAIWNSFNSTVAANPAGPSSGSRNGSPVQR